ncbi:uncharacterized protein ARMOST_10951 [Armillaria ostoyae]|uniref:LysM domain-containing protein n=1 Tax=Armillaria ostoyae TaxID=47428 RepID=A0A284RFS0_ARMOS|nr:uncharacterized protein ARMOST_10951 [Armillaria ostoyae]
MFARTFILIAAAIIGVNAACDSGLPGYTHIVNPGETCWGIATQGGIDVARLETANPSLNCDLLVVGQAKALRSQQLMFDLSKGKGVLKYVFSSLFDLYFFLPLPTRRSCLLRINATKATYGRENDSDKNWRQLVKTLIAAYLHGFRARAPGAEQSHSGFDLIGAEYCQKRDIIDGSADEVITSCTRRFIRQPSYSLPPGGIPAASIFDAVPPPGASGVRHDGFRS